MIPEPTESDIDFERWWASEGMAGRLGSGDAKLIARRAWATAESQLAAASRDWSADHTHLQALCRAAGVPEQQVTGDSHGVPGIADLADLLAGRLAAMTAARDKLQAFKDWTHNYLDAHGVPHHPPGTHGAAGCRIGDRMDWLMAQLAALRAEVERLRVREAELVEGLRPFAAMAAAFPDIRTISPHKNEHMIYYVNKHNVEAGFTVGDVRRAAALIKEPDHGD